MGEFDDFLADDDDDSMKPVANETFNTLATGNHALVDVLSFVRGKCSTNQLEKLKVLYLTRKERCFSLVEFLRQAKDVLGTELLMQAMVSSRTVADRSSKMRAHSVQDPQQAGTKKGGLKSDQKSAPVSNINKKTVAESAHKGVVNLDVSQEAGDVLAIAGVNTEDEAKLLFAKQTERQRLDTDFSDFETKDKDPWRKIIELRIFARIGEKGGLISSTGIAQVNEKVYDYLEEALQVRLKNFVANVCGCAARRNDANRSAFKKSLSALEPKQKIRSINVSLEQEKGERLEKERQALLRVGQTILNKRKRDVEENTFLKEKVAKVRQEEEERIRATAANQAARDALGDAKYLKWYDMAKSNNAHGGAKSRSTGAVADDHVTDAKPQEPELKGTKVNSWEKLRPNTTAVSSLSGNKSIIIRDCVEALHDDDHGSRLFSSLFPR